MKFVSISVALASLLLTPSFSVAQLDSSYELLLGSSTRNSSIETTKPVRAETKKKRTPSSAPGTETVTALVPEAAPATNVQAPANAQASPNTASAADVEEPTLSQQAKSIFNSDSKNLNNFYEDKFAENDPRHNRVEISLAPGFSTSESSSNFSYRNYRSVFSGLNLGANVWLTPALGIGGNYLFSFGADTSADAVTGTRTPARFEMLDIGIKFRKFFGFSPTSKSIQFDLLYTDSEMNVPADDLYRARLKSSGVGMKMTLRVPTSAEVAWLLSGTFFPRLQHVEEKTGISIQSGNNIENTRIGLQVGSEVTLSQQSQIFYELSGTSERNLFEGFAGIADPATGTRPKNVSVTNSIYMFSLGYRWGN